MRENYVPVQIDGLLGAAYIAKDDFEGPGTTVVGFKALDGLEDRLEYLVSDGIMIVPAPSPAEQDEMAREAFELREVVEKLHDVARGPGVMSPEYLDKIEANVVKLEGWDQWEEFAQDMLKDYENPILAQQTAPEQSSFSLLVPK